MTRVRIPYIKAFIDRHGRPRHYFRRGKGTKTLPLPGLPGSAEFMQAYELALSGQGLGAVGKKGAFTPTRPGRLPGTVAALIADYLASPAFDNLKPASRKVYLIVLDRFGDLHGHRMVHDMPRSAIAAYVQAIGTVKPGMANLTRAVLRKLLAHAIRAGYRNDNPVTEIDRYKSGTRHTWSEAELAMFEHRWSLGTRERLAFAILLYTGQRGGDVVRMRRADVSGGAISICQQKTGTTLSIPIHHDLALALKAGPSNGLNLIGDEAGRPMQRQALTRLMKLAAAAAGLPPECLPHGLRKSQMRRLAEGGASAKQIAAISGHKSLREVERYTAAADQKRLSRGAIAKLGRKK